MQKWEKSKKEVAALLFLFNSRQLVIQEVQNPNLGGFVHILFLRFLI